MSQAISSPKVTDNQATDFSNVGTIEHIDSVPEQILKRSSYIVSYNKDSRCPNWVAWRLTAKHTLGEVKRMGNAFHEGMDVPTPRAVNADFKDSGFLVAISALLGITNGIETQCMKHFSSQMFVLKTLI